MSAADENELDYYTVTEALPLAGPRELIDRDMLSNIGEDSIGSPRGSSRSVSNKLNQLTKTKGSSPLTDVHSKGDSDPSLTRGSDPFLEESYADPTHGVTFRPREGSGGGSSSTSSSHESLGSPAVHLPTTQHHPVIPDHESEVVREATPSMEATTLGGAIPTGGSISQGETDSPREATPMGEAPPMGSSPSLKTTPGEGTEKAPVDFSVVSQPESITGDHSASPQPLSFWERAVTETGGLERTATPIEEEEEEEEEEEGEEEEASVSSTTGVIAISDLDPSINPDTLHSSTDPSSPISSPSSHENHLSPSSFSPISGPFVPSSTHPDSNPMVTEIPHKTSKRDSHLHINGALSRKAGLDTKRDGLHDDLRHAVMADMPLDFQHGRLDSDSPALTTSQPPTPPSNASHYVSGVTTPSQDVANVTSQTKKTSPLAAAAAPEVAVRPRRKTLHIGGLFELSDTVAAQNGRSELAAAKMAVDHINKQDVVSGYTLKLVHNDTKVSNVSPLRVYYNDYTPRVSHCSLEIVIQDPHFSDEFRKQDQV